MNKRQGSRITKSSLNQIALEAAAKAGYHFRWESTQYPFWDQLGFSAAQTSELESFKSGIVAWLDKWAIAHKDGARIDKESFKAIFRASIGADDSNPPANDKPCNRQSPKQAIARKKRNFATQQTSHPNNLSSNCLHPNCLNLEKPKTTDNT